MTLDDLKQLRYLPHLIETLKLRIETLREQADVHSISFDRVPGGNGPNDRIGRIVPTIIDQETELQRQIDELEERRRECEQWVAKLPARIRLIVTLRFLECKNWEAIADEMDDGSGRTTSDALRAALRRYMRDYGT